MTQGVVVINRLLVQPIGPIFEGQETSWILDPWRCYG